MNILIVSFDKSVVSKLREALSQHNILEVRNGEEAINTVSSYVDAIVYDAVSGVISEEDINNMYMQKFKDAKYVILVDDLFPVDVNKLLPPNKVEVIRDKVLRENGAEIVRDLIEGKEVEKDVIELEKLPLQMEVSGADMQMEELGLEEAIERAMTKLDAVPKKRILIVSFDLEIIRKLTDALSEEAEVVEVKNMKEATEKAKEADVIIFDTISAMLAQRTLIEMSKDENLAKKPYILLIDELFTIDAESIPLQKKYTFAREAELSKVVDKALELVRGLPSEVLAETFQEEVGLEPKPSTSEEEISIMSLLEEIIGAGKEETTPATSEKPEEITISEQTTEQPAFGEALADNLASAIKDLVRAQLSQEKLYSIISQVINYEDLREHVSKTVERSLEDALKSVIQETLSSIDVAKVIREEAYKVLKERLKELIT
ncbi:MAG: hypothetical protein RMK75_00215 [Aquificaceae bacterium]|nr:hypothetical protein [Aquificaceae bacterium]MDW8422736.1 hypothetical protein [Aquificaceae bacterium]